MINVGIVGSTGYTGTELIRFLAKHPEVKIAGVTSQSYVGQRYSDIFPNTEGFIDLECEEQDMEVLLAKSDVIFTALPHGVSMEVVAVAEAKGKKVIDLGADYRFDSVKVYEEWYKVQHKTPELAEKAVYGLPEIHRQDIKGSQVVGNPGCYPTSIILGLAPLLKNNLIKTETLIIDSKSGVSGGGRGLNLGFHYAECNENLKAYNIGAHRHTPEIEQELGKLAGKELTVSFTPHLIPMTRGILSTIYASLHNAETSTEKILALYRDFYKQEFFVRIHPEGRYPQTKYVYGSNFCDIGIKFDARTGRVVVVSVIDNLVKGAVGQAIQNMNLLFELPEKTGIDYPGMWP